MTIREIQNGICDISPCVEGTSKVLAAIYQAMVNGDNCGEEYGMAIWLAGEQLERSSKELSALAEAKTAEVES